MSERLRDPLGIDLHAGVGRFMHSVYAWMAAGVGLSAATAIALSSEPRLELAQASELRVLFWPAMAVAVLVIGARLHRLPPTVARVAFLTFSVLLGAALAWLGSATRVSAEQLGTAAGVAAGVFVAGSLVGFYSRRDLSPWGAALATGLIGALVAMFLDAAALRQPGLHVLLQALLAVVFAGFVAYDGQRVKQMYRTHGRRENLAVVGALKLYLDYVNLTLATLQITSGQ
ncbi:Bax inhibitor-1/YccA family protein [Nannocystis bainbridge]|uniref:Bax inhibitor-1/YccA family protein n=1 Tax=Nannocystis bainbridge TaxID=2995303 RepID=A0ABT5E2F0_9BACT|nr:Bax inhibitor-1/YccA family protein [Nannocystis bainbridge]MDC0719991.1 Bax inhibitor-1/YccA family protein [Nannocystis bainbridge]